MTIIIHTGDKRIQYCEQSFHNDAKPHIGAYVETYDEMGNIKGYESYALTKEEAKEEIQKLIGEMMG